MIYVIISITSTDIASRIILIYILPLADTTTTNTSIIYNTALLLLANLWELLLIHMILMFTTEKR